jgi:hypothetical protein
LHVARPPPHAHDPETQFAPVPQTTLHAPQLEGSVSRSVQAPLQFACDAEHVVVHTPAEHTCPPATLHVVPQPPQFFGSLWMSVQTLLQRMPLS